MSKLTSSVTYFNFKGSPSKRSHNTGLFDAQESRMTIDQIISNNSENAEYLFTGVDEFNETLEKNYLTTLQSIMLVDELSDAEKQAINAIGHEYEKNRKAVDVLMDDK